MTTEEKINGVTAKITREPDAPSHFPKFKSIESLIADMIKRDVIYKFANINGERVAVKLEKTDEANDNWYENEMRINNHFHDLPIAMFK